MSDNGNETRTTPAVVYVVDDEPSICRLFEKVCGDMGFETRTFSRAEDFLQAYDPSLTGCVVLDVYLPSMSGLDLLEEIANRGWHMPIVIVSGRAEVSTAVRAFKLGSIDFLEKPFTKEQIEGAVQHAVELDRERRVEQGEIDEIRRRIGRLTPRERQVMDLVVAGKSNRLIAEDLGVSPKTVEVHRANVMQKMQADSLARLVKMVMAERTGKTEPGQTAESTTGS